MLTLQQLKRIEELKRIKDQNTLKPHERLELANLEMKRRASGQSLDQQVQLLPQERLAAYAATQRSTQLANDEQALRRRNEAELQQREEVLRQQQEKVRSSLLYR